MRVFEAEATTPPFIEGGRHVLRLLVSLSARAAARLVACAAPAAGLFLLSLVLGGPTSAAAQQGGKDLRLGLGAVLDFAGKSKSTTASGRTTTTT